jgi:hypothetical protein
LTIGYEHHTFYDHTCSFTCKNPHSIVTKYLKIYELECVDGRQYEASSSTAQPSVPTLFGHNL